jgi:hypothetical protein
MTCILVEIPQVRYLSASETIICPQTAVVLGTQPSIANYTQGTQPSIANYAELLDPLDQATTGKESQERIRWSDELLLAFKTAQQTLDNNKTISLPQSDEALWIVTNGSVKNYRSLAVTLYIQPDGISFY